MEFRIADTFTDSLARLTSEEQKAVKTTAFDLQLNPASPGMSFHKLDRAKDKNFWSVRVNADVRLIVHKTPGSLLLCYVDHHDNAYDWAARRKLPFGLVSVIDAQLARHSQRDRLDEVLDEVQRVQVEVGQPPLQAPEGDLKIVELHQEIAQLRAFERRYGDLLDLYGYPSGA